MSLQNLRCDLHILKAPVRTRADDHLIDLDRLRNVHHALRILRQMRERNDGAQRAEVDLHRTRILRVGIGMYRLKGRLHAFLDVRSAHVIIREDAVLSARLDRHVGNRQTIGHREIRNALARELEALVERAVHADHADQRQDDILAADVSRLLPRQADIDRLGHLEPRLARRHADRQIGRADAR